MEVITSPYLEAIQALAGSTPSQKHTELNSIARRAANHAKASGDASKVPIELSDVPEPLVPLVRLEAARILKQKEVIAEALVSHDPDLLNRALRTYWFFQSSNKEYINTKYFKENLLPSVALNTRIKLLKNLVTSFNIKGETELAEEFYALVTNLYGRGQAEPLLEACGENFIWNEVYKEDVVLTCRMLKSLFLKYPEMIIRYLKLGFPSNGKSCNFSLSEYRDFYPRLVKNHSAAMIEILEARDNCADIQLSNKAIDRFLKLNMDAVLKKPRFFTQMISLKTLAKKITNTQYKTLFTNVFPEKIEKYSHRDVEDYLNYYSEDERIPMLLETFKNVYGSSMLDRPNLITPEIMRKLSVEERARQARIKLETDDNWRKLWTIQSIWRCYLPKEEIWPLIKTDISKSSSPEDRSCLLSQMILVCSVNNDKQELLQFLEYFTTRHKNELPKLIYEVLRSLRSMFKLETLSPAHFSIIENFFKYLEIKDVFRTDYEVTEEYMVALVYIKLTNNQSIDEQMKCLVEMKVRRSHPKWCIFPDHPEYDKLCFEKFIEMLRVQHSNNFAKFNTIGQDILRSTVSSIYIFNRRHTEKIKDEKIEKLSLRNYKWLFDIVKRMMTEEKGKNLWDVIRALKNEIRNNELDVYEEWFPPQPKEEPFPDLRQARKLLKKNSARILADIEKYFIYLRNFKTLRGDPRLFIKACRWHQEIPMQLLALSLKNINSKDSTYAILILAMLVEGSVFEKIVEPLLPVDTKTLDVKDENTKSMFQKARAIAFGINYTRPAVSLDFVARLCDGEFLRLGLISVANVCTRTPVQKVEAFAKKLAESPVSVKKHGIQLYCGVATISNYRNFLTSIWKKEKHRSIRILIFKKIYKLFLDELDLETWKMLENCISGMTVDDTDFLDIILNFDKIPWSFLPSYIPLVWQSVENLREQGFDKKLVQELTLKILQAISGPMCKVLPDEFANKLFHKFFCMRHLSMNQISVGMSYTLNGYLLADETKIEMRLKNFHDFLVDLIKKDWNVESCAIHIFYPTNWLVHRFVHRYLKPGKTDQKTFRIISTMLEVFSECFDDMRQVYSTFTYLYVGIGLQGSNSPETLAQKFAILYPGLVEKISPGLVIKTSQIIADWVYEFVGSSLKEQTLIQVIKCLININTEESSILAVELLTMKTDSEHALEDRDIFLSLRNSKFPVVAGLAIEYFDICATAVHGSTKVIDL